MKIRNLLLVLLCITALNSSAQLVIRGGDALTGTVSSVHGTRVGILDERIVFDASNAKVVGEFGPSRLSEVKKGDRVHATIAGTIDGRLTASQLLILSDPDALLAGAAEQIDSAGGSVTLLEQRVRVTGATLLRGLHGEPLASLGAIVRGQHITVALDAAQPGLAAKSVTVSSPAPFYPTELEGTIDAIQNDLWTIVAPNARITVRVTAETTIVGTPRVGDLVFVTFRSGNDGLKVAISIGPRTATPQPAFDVRGIVSRITTSAITLTNDAGDEALEAAIDANTTFDGARPSTGDRVVVTMRRLPDDTFLAVRVVADTTQSALTFNGTVTMMGLDEWQIDEQRMAIDGNTRIARTLQVGEKVRVTAMRTSDGLLALEIARAFPPRQRISTN
ncbi:MAG TPA: DUF5666 domain-containing protein [Thermoanaerobaculia bacterium]|nr:DUF5666 domain-containing protein [Thermoanaerobaculia bacterium]